MIPAIGKQRPEDLEFKASLSCLERPVLYKERVKREGEHMCALEIPFVVSAECPEFDP